MSAPGIEGSPAAPRRQALGALRHPNYRLFFSGQVVSTVGTWMQSVAHPWLVLRLTHSGFLVGAVVAAQSLPVLVAGPLGGLVADRFPKRRVLQVTQAAFIAPAMFLFAVTETRQVTYWMVLMSALAWGVIQVADVPTRQSFAIEMVGKEDLMSAIALNSTAWNAAAVVGPAVAGLLISAAGLPLCFLVNAVSFLAVIAALALMRDLPPAMPRRGGPLLETLAAGVRQVRRDPLLASMLLLVAVFSLFTMQRLTLLPLFADQVLRVGATGFGLLLGALGLGALTSAIGIAIAARKPSGRGQLLVGFAWTAALVLFSSSRWFPLSLATMYAAGICQMMFLATANGRIQIASPDGLRGRMMALYAQAVMGVSPMGAMTAGGLASLWGAPAAMTVGALVATLVLALVWALNPGVFR